jgi:hypothetical protein
MNSATLPALLVAGQVCLVGWQASVADWILADIAMNRSDRHRDSAVGDLSNPPGGGLWEPSRKLTGIGDGTAAP